MILLTARTGLALVRRPVPDSRRVAAVLLALLLGMLYASAQDVTPSPTPPPAAALDAGDPAQTTRHPASDSYVLRKNDLIKLTVFQEDDMTTETRVSKSGYITLPLLGAVEVAGKSVADATNEIRTKLDKDYIINPQVTLTVMQYAEQWVTVLGEVQKPGQVEIPPEGGLDLLGAIALAGGYTRVADPTHVIVRRVINGRDVVARVNAFMLAHDTQTQEFMVQPGDRISVGESMF